MKVVSWEDLLAGKSGIQSPVSLSIGVFDGVHLGHRRLLSAITGSSALPLIVSFRENPALVLARDSFPGPILTIEQKFERLEALGIGAVVVIDFSEQLSRLSGKAFVRSLRENLTIEKLAVGYNFRFGKDRDTDARALGEMLRGTKTEIFVAQPVLYGDAPVSSSRIRTAIREGSLGEARAMLAASHSIDLRHVPLLGESLRGTLRAIRVRRFDIRQCLPKPGSYPVSCEAEAAAVSGLLTVREDSVELELSGGGKITEARFLSD